MANMLHRQMRNNSNMKCLVEHEHLIEIYKK